MNKDVLINDLIRKDPIRAGGVAPLTVTSHSLMWT